MAFKRESALLEIIHCDLGDFFHASPSLGNKKYVVTYISMIILNFVMCIYCIQRIRLLINLKFIRAKLNFKREP